MLAFCGGRPTSLETRRDLSSLIVGNFVGALVGVCFGGGGVLPSVEETGRFALESTLRVVERVLVAMMERVNTSRVHPW